MTLPVGSPSAITGKEEYSAKKEVPSRRHRSSLSSRTGRPVDRVWSSGQSATGKGEPSGRVWWIATCMLRPSRSSAEP